MKFQIEQIAIVPKDPIAAKKLLSEIGATEWSEDHVVATGNVFGVRDTNEADLSFNYDLFSAEDLVHWRAFFENRDIEVAQEVFTDSHTNPVIAGKRSYNYVIFDTKNILGVDLKFIVRINKDANSI